MEAIMITEKQIEKRKRELAEEKRDPAVKAKRERREKLEQVRKDIVEYLVKGAIEAAIFISEGEGILFEIPRKYLEAGAASFLRDVDPSCLLLARKIYSHLGNTGKVADVDRRLPV